MVDLRRDISSHLLEESTVSWDQGVSKIRSDMSLAPPIVVHASLLRIILAWCKRFSFYVHGWWTMSSIPCCLCIKPSNPCCLSTVNEINHDWNAVISTFLSNHNPSRVMDFYHIFDRIPERVNDKWHGVSGEARLM
jgi:hypothetical protein